jgi:hypothetical protein
MSRKEGVAQPQRGIREYFVKSDPRRTLRRGSLCENQYCVLLQAIQEPGLVARPH